MTEWTPCSRTCGKGTQNRQIACTQQLRNGTLIRARERDCLGPKPASAQRCEGQDCMTVWEAGVWSEVPHLQLISRHNDYSLVFSESVGLFLLAKCASESSCNDLEPGLGKQAWKTSIELLHFT